ncbi:MAG TPA: hypothetical protein VMY34_09695, partial [Acidimicrobiales bacterium]|nr:hypothetical protein [Acidimicrobiales bacterium]
MHHVELKRHMGETDIAAVTELLDLAAAVDGHRPLGEHQWLDLVHGGRKGFAGLVAWEAGHDHPVGYAQVTGEQGNWAMELVVSPHHRDDSVIAEDLLRGALDVVREQGGGHLHLWVPKPTEAHDEIAAKAGLQRGRDLLQMRRALPVEEPFVLDVRPFVVGRDEEAWLDVNNRAFARHPEQGDWNLATVRQREGEPWFDADGFLVHERDGRMAGFCWTKVHPEEALGEIYVI